MIRLAALFCGLLCGTGLMLSGLFQPTLLQGLFTPGGARDLTLALGLVSALVAAAMVLALARGLSRPLLRGQGETPGDAPTGKALLGGLPVSSPWPRLLQLASLRRGLQSFWLRCWPGCFCMTSVPTVAGSGSTGCGQADKVRASALGQHGIGQPASSLLSTRAGSPQFPGS